MKQRLLGILCLIALVSQGLGGTALAIDEPSSAPVLDPWQLLEGPSGGSVTAVAMSPNYALDHIVFAGLRGQGVYRTVSWGQTWERTSPDPWAVVDLAISPAFATDGTLFVSQGLWTAGYDVFRTSDEGDTWQDVSPAWSALPYPPLLSISPDFENDGTVYVLGGAQTYLSTDGGDTFVQAGGWFAGHTVSELAFSPAYAADTTLFALVPADGLYKSTDGGTSWLPTGLSGDLSTMAVSPNYAVDTMLLAVTAVDGRLHTSNDGGGSWTPGSLYLNPGGQHTLCFSPSYSPADQVILAASSADPGPYRSIDGGMTWEQSDWHDPANNYPGGFVGGGVYALALAPAGIWDPAGYAGTSTGMYHSYNRGEDWFQGNDGLPHLTVRALAIAPGAPETWLAGTSHFDHLRFDSTSTGEYDGSLQLSRDGGRTWNDVSGRLDRVNSVAFSPTFATDQTAFAVAGTIGQHGYYDGGIYRSFDGGVNWEEVLGASVYQALAISPNFAADRTVWASAYTYSTALGILASYDGGEVWTPLAPGVHAQILVASPNYTADHTLFAGTADAGLQRSTDGGTSWSQVLAPSVTSLAISPVYGASRTLYAGVRAGPSEPGDLYRSTDGGDSWQLLDSGIPDYAGDDSLHLSTLAFAYDGSVLVGTYYGHEQGAGAVYRSTDGGETWQPLGVLWNDSSVLALTSLPSLSLAFFAGTNRGLWELDVPQGGPAEPGTWTSSGPRGGRAHALAVSPDFASGGVALAGTGTMGRHGNAWGLGIFASTDGGETWQPSPMDPPDTWSSSAIYDYAFSPGFSSDQTAFAATWGGLFKSTDGGQNWQQAYRAFMGWPGSFTAVAVAPDYPSSGHMMAGSPWGGIYNSRDGGLNWSVDTSLGPVSEIAYSPYFGTDGTAYALGVGDSGSELYRTTDAATSWTPVLTEGICSLAVSPDFAADGTLYAGGDALYASLDRGATWISHTLPVTTYMVCALAVSPAFATDQTLFAAAGNGLYRSADGGANWTQVTGYTGPPVRALAISPGWPAHPVLLAGTGAGVYRTTDGGDTWLLSEGMTALSTGSLALAADGRSLTTGAYQYGIYGSSNSGASWSPLGLQESDSRPADIALSPGYPADGTIFVALANTMTMGGNIGRTTDGGATWDLVQSADYVYKGALAISPGYVGDHTVYAAAGGRVMVSVDGGDTWSEVGAWPAGVYRPARIILLPPNYPADGTRLSAGDGFYRLPPGAITWEPAASGLTPDISVESVAISPGYASDRTLLATGGWYDAVEGNQYRVFRSSDGGVNWQTAGSGLPNASLRYVAFSPNFAADRTAYLTCEDQLYRSLDGGQSWTAVGAAPGLPDLFEPIVDREGGVYIASGNEYHAAGNGVWHYTTPAQDIMIDGGFEAGSGWDLPNTAHKAARAEQVVYDGAWSMRIGVDNGPISGAAYSSARQVVTIPTDAVSATLTVHLYAMSGEAVTAAASQLFATGAVPANGPGAITATGDAQYLLVLDPTSGSILETLLWQKSNSQAWKMQVFDLLPYAGRSIRLHLGVYNDGAGGSTGMFVDNVSLLVWGRGPVEPSHQHFLPVIVRNSTD